MMIQIGHWEYRHPSKDYKVVMNLAYLASYEDKYGLLYVEFGRQYNTRYVTLVKARKKVYIPIAEHYLDYISKLFSDYSLLLRIDSYVDEDRKRAYNLIKHYLVSVHDSIYTSFT